MHGEGRGGASGAEKIPSLHSSTSLAFLSPSPVGAACQPPPGGSALTLALLSSQAASACAFALELIPTSARSAGLQCWQQRPRAGTCPLHAPVELPPLTLLQASCPQLQEGRAPETAASCSGSAQKGLTGRATQILFYPSVKWE